MNKIRHLFFPLPDFLIRLGLIFVFLYFGIFAVIDPVGQGAAWVAQAFVPIITTVVSIKTFMLILGSVQILAALGLLLNVGRMICLGLMFLLLGGIIFNLSVSIGFINDLVARDAGLALVALGLFIKESSDTLKVD